MKQISAFWIASIIAIFSSFSAFSQTLPPCDNNTPPPGETACLATPICNFNGYCGRTLSSYTADAWQDLSDAICNATGGFLFGACMGMTIENDSYLKFIATATTVTFDVYVYDCQGTGSKAIQVVFFKADNCGSGPVTLLNTNDNLTQNGSPHTITASGFTPGQVYYILIDGVSGENCGYTFQAVAGVQDPAVNVTATPTSVCVGGTSTATVTGGTGTYTWSGASGLSSTSGSTVTITPPSTVGSYQYNVESNGGNAFCPTQSKDSVTISVTNCNGCTPPNLNIQAINVCSPNTADLNNAVGTGSDAATKTFYSSQADANAATNAINNTVSASGTYWIRAENPTDATCFQVFSVQVNVTKVTYTAVTTDVNCGATDGKIVITAANGASPYTYSADGGQNFQASDTVSGLSANTYNIVVKDNNGCQATGTEQVNSIGGPTVTLSATNSSCVGVCDGKLSASVSGGALP